MARSRYEDDDRGHEARSYSAQRSAMTRDRDEYGQFTGGQGQRYGSGQRDRYGQFTGGQSGRSQERDQYGQFIGGRANQYSGQRGGFDDRDRYRESWSGQQNVSRYEDDDRDYDGRSMGGYRSASMQDRSEQGQFTGRRSQGQYYGQDGNWSQGRQGYGGSSRYDEDDDRGYQSYGQQSWSGGRQRDEYGQFTGGRAGSQYDYDDDTYSGSRAGGSNRYQDYGGNRGYQSDQWRSGQYSGGQERDRYGQFTGRRDNDYDDDYSTRGTRSQGRSSQYYEYDDDDDRRSSSHEPFGGDEGRSRGGQHSARIQERDEQGQFEGRSGREDDDDDDSRSRRRSTTARSGQSRSDDDDDDNQSSTRSGTRRSGRSSSGGSQTSRSRSGRSSSSRSR